MPRHLHGDPLRHPGVDEVPDRRAPEVVPETASHASCATRLVCDLAQRDLGLRQLRLSVVAGHDTARAVYEKNGFVEEAVQRDAVLIDGSPADLVLMVYDCPPPNERQGG